MVSQWLLDALYSVNLYVVIIKWNSSSTFEAIWREISMKQRTFVGVHAPQTPIYKCVCGVWMWWSVKVTHNQHCTNRNAKINNQTNTNINGWMKYINIFTKLVISCNIFRVKTPPAKTFPSRPDLNRRVAISGWCASTHRWSPIVDQFISLAALVAACLLCHCSVSLT